MSWPAYTMPGVLPLVFVALSVGLIIAPLRAFSREYSAVSRPWSGVSLAGIVVVGATALVVFAGSDDGYFFPQPKTEGLCHDSLTVRRLQTVALRHWRDRRYHQ